MTNRKILYGYQIQNGEITVQAQEAIVVRRITTLYLDGLSYQKIAEILNRDHIPFSAKASLWNKHKVKRLLENPRYTGTNGYPAIIDAEIFQDIQRKIQSKTEGCVKSAPRPALLLKDYLQCACDGKLHRTAGPKRRKDTLYLKCGICGKQFTMPDVKFLSEVTRQMADHSAPSEDSYTPSSEAVRLTNAINRGLENPSHPEDVVALILQGISARYNCCPAPIESETFNCPTEVDFKSFGQAVSYITITDENCIMVHFK